MRIKSAVSTALIVCFVVARPASKLRRPSNVRTQGRFVQFLRKLQHNAAHLACLLTITANAPGATGLKLSWHT
jgi:hypothetical protein